MPKIRVLLAEDHTIVASGLRSLLEQEFDLVGVVPDGRALLDAAAQLSPDVVVTDISMPGLNGLDAIRKLVERKQTQRIVVLTMHREPALAAEAFQAGALGYVLKVSPVDELVTAIKEAANGRSFVTTLVTGDFISFLMDAVKKRPQAEGDALTLRQREVLQLIAEGKTMKEIGAQLKISPRTVESHKYEIMGALNLKTTAELVQYAVRTRLVAE